MKVRLLEFLTLVAVLALAAQYAGNERRDAILNRALSLDGVRIGMSYELHHPGSQECRTIPTSR